MTNRKPKCYMARLLKYITIIAWCTSIPFTSFSQQWVKDSTGKFFTWQVYTLYAVKDTLFISGWFNSIGSIHARGIARYHNGKFDSLRGGINGEAYAMIYARGSLYVGGYFSYAINLSNPVPWEQEIVPYSGGLARWDGNRWHWVDTLNKCNSICINDMVYHNNHFYFAGYTPGSFIYHNTSVVRWDGPGQFVYIGKIPQVTDNLEIYRDKLYAICFWGLLKYEGDTTWNKNPFNNYFPTGTNLYVDTINDFFYIAGTKFVGNPPIPSYGIAMWDGFRWHSMGNALMAANSMKVYRGHLYIATDTILWDGTRVNYICYWDWDTKRYYPLGSGLNNWPLTFEVFHDTLWVGGRFSIAGGDSARGLARWYAPPDTICRFLRPLVQTLNDRDTFYLVNGEAQVQFYTNNRYAQSWLWEFGDGSDSQLKDPLHIYTDTGTYNVSVTVTHKMVDDTTRTCTKTATRTIYIRKPIGIESIDIEKINFIVYPNPTSGDFVVECTLPDNKTGKIRIHDIHGGLMKEYAVYAGCNHIEVPASQWTARVYLCGLYINDVLVRIEKTVKY